MILRSAQKLTWQAAAQVAGYKRRFEYTIVPEVFFDCRSLGDGVNRQVTMLFGSPSNVDRLLAMLVWISR